MKRGYLVLALIALTAVALTVPALGGSARPTAKISASVKKTAKKALQKAENAQQAADAAQSSANAAQGSANAAQGSANAAQSSANAAQGSANAITGGSEFDDVCDPTSTTFDDCVGVTLTLAQSGRVLLNATGGQLSDPPPGPAEGDCRLEVDDSTATIPHSTTNSPGEDATDNTEGSAINGFALTAVTNVLPAGSHTFELSCSEDSGNQQINDSFISAVRISG
jgi:hypothetical protein